MLFVRGAYWAEMSITFAPFEESMADAAARVHHAAWHFAAEMYRAAETQYFPLEKFQKNWLDFCEDPKGKIALMAMDGGRVVGLVRYAPLAVQDADGWTVTNGALLAAALSRPSGQLHQFYNLPEYMNRGIGSKLCATALGDMAARGAKYAFIERNSQNWISAGFQTGRLLSTDVASYPEIDVPKGQWGAPRDITSTDIMAVANVDDALRKLEMLP
jgi:ribosomal protein S18 acetylase RimI-like enzyme